MEEVEFSFVRTNGIQLHVAQLGPANGPLMVLLHGFPEFWYGWKKHLPALAAAGYRVWAPDQRGYNLSDKPPRVRDYQLDLLVQDILGLLDQAGRERATVIGHDWGAVVAWWLASNYPERLERAVIINVPHPLVMRRLLLSSPRQLLRSWYVFALQLPYLPEWGARRRNWHDVVNVMRSSSLPGTFSDQDFDEYRRAWSQPGAYSAMVNWYRAIMRHGLRSPRHSRIPTPLRILWGQRDQFIGPEAADLSLEKCERGELIRFEENTHWVQHERPEDICRQILKPTLPPPLPSPPGLG